MHAFTRGDDAFPHGATKRLCKTELFACTMDHDSILYSRFELSQHKFPLRLRTPIFLFVGLYRGYQSEAHKWRTNLRVKNVGTG